MFSSEYVTPGHPDKVADQISDAILDAHLEQDPYARVASEVLLSGGGIVLAGEITSSADVDHSGVALRVLSDIGYSAENYLAMGLPVINHIIPQSTEIGAGVFRDNDIGAGDQGIMFGYATSSTDDAMPRMFSQARRIALGLYEDNQGGMFGPDGKVQLSGGNDATESILVSLQHHADVSQEQVREHILNHLNESEREVTIITNPSGSFVVGGPAADTGLTGRKIIVDTYGGYARHGGGCFSGKDASKVDRTGAYAARWIAKSLVKSGLLDEANVQIGYGIGIASPLSLSVYGHKDGREVLPGSRESDSLIELVNRRFDLRPAALIESLGLRLPIFERTARLGHFGVEGNSWEVPVSL